MPAESKGPISSWERAVAGATGAVLANALVYPLDVVKTRLQVQVSPGKWQEKRDGDRPDESGEPSTKGPTPYASTLDAILRIAADDGIGGLYIGISGSLVGVASTNFAYFYWYSVVRSLYTRSGRGQGPPSTTAELSLGAVSGAIAQLCTIPIAVVTTRQQTSRGSDRKGVVGTVREIINTDDGISGLWRGLKASLVLVVNPAITYGAYERLKRTLFPGQESLRPWQAFFLGALSKTLATVVTHPLIVAKVGLQSKPPPTRNGVAFSSFVEVLCFIWEHEGLAGLFKGIGPQIMKGLLVQGILMMTKERLEVRLAVIFHSIKLLQKKNLSQIMHSTSIKQSMSSLI